MSTATARPAARVSRRGETGDGAAGCEEEGTVGGETVAGVVLRSRRVADNGASTHAAKFDRCAARCA
jgi:hypothetical protein